MFAIQGKIRRKTAARKKKNGNSDDRTQGKKLKR